MRKNNWIVYIIAIIASAFLLWLWYHLHFDAIDAPLDLVLSIIWWALIAIVCWRIHRIEKKRRERIRTCYVRDGLLYNSEAGTRQLSSEEPGAIIAAMQGVLANLEYGFDIQDRPEDGEGGKLPFDFVVRSVKFEVEQDADEQAGTPARIDWEGNVSSTARPDDEPIPFGTTEELRNVLAALC